MFSKGGTMSGILKWVVIFCFLFSATAYAAPVWLVTKEDKQFYLAGTIHLLSETDYPLPTAFEQAFANSEHFWFETDLQQMASPQGTMQLLAQNTYPPGQDLQQHLSPPVFQQLQAAAASRHWPLATLKQFKPAFAAMTITVLELQRLGAAGTGVDLYYWQKAQAANRPTSGLETLEQHLAVLTAMNQLDANEVMLATLQDLDKLQQVLGKMKLAWKQGDIAQLEVLFLADLQQYPELEQLLLTRRNQQWMRQLTQPSMHNSMVFVGALHLAGEHSLLTLLADAGYQLTQLTSLAD